MAVSPVGTFFIVLVVLLVFAAVSWIVFTQLRARRLGVRLPFPVSTSFTAPSGRIMLFHPPDIAVPAFAIPLPFTSRLS
jgi:hypothetical protein